MRKHKIRWAITTGTSGPNLENWVDEVIDEIRISTPRLGGSMDEVGVAYLQVCRVGKLVFAHSNRHGYDLPLREGRYALPTEIKHKPFVWALASQGVEHVIGLSIGGVIDRCMDIGTTMVLNDCVTPHWMHKDLSWWPEAPATKALPRRPYFRDNIRPFCPAGRLELYRHCVAQGLITVPFGRLELIPGPDFETPGDCDVQRSHHVHIAGMPTSLPEPYLFRRLGIGGNILYFATDDPMIEAKQKKIERVCKESMPKMFEAAVRTFQAAAAGKVILTAPKPISRLRQALKLPA